MAKLKAGEEQKINELLNRNVEDIIEREHLAAALFSGKKLRVKFGIDPTAPYLHLGHTIPLLKLRAFQELGHKAVLIIGDFTARVGDPSGRTETRPPLSASEIKKNMKSYLKQAGLILDLKKTEIRYNSEWLAKLRLADIAELLSAATAAHILKREDFAKRMTNGADITMLETFYPLLQGYDSVAVKADVELGGQDQLLNLLMGRKVQRFYGMKEQDVMTFPLLLGLDGVKKMSKSFGNYVGITEAPEEMFGKLMSMRDEMIVPYFRSATDLPETEVRAFETQLKAGDNPKDIKAILAEVIVARYHGDKLARKAAEKFEGLFSKKEAGAENLPVLPVNKKENLLDVIFGSGVVSSKSEARRLIQQGAVRIDDRPLRNPLAEGEFKGGEVLKIGKRHFFRIKI